MYTRLALSFVVLVSWFGDKGLELNHLHPYTYYGVNSIVKASVWKFLKRNTTTLLCVYIYIS